MIFRPEMTTINLKKASYQLDKAFRLVQELSYKNEKNVMVHFELKGGGRSFFQISVGREEELKPGFGN
jgi:hypothetical protein